MFDGARELGDLRGGGVGCPVKHLEGHMISEGEKNDIVRTVCFEKIVQNIADTRPNKLKFSSCYWECVMDTNDLLPIDWRVLCYSSTYLISASRQCVCVSLLCAYLGRCDPLTLHVLFNGQRKTTSLVYAADLRGGDEDRDRWVGGVQSDRDKMVE